MKGLGLRDKSLGVLGLRLRGLGSRVSDSQIRTLEMVDCESGRQHNSAWIFLVTLSGQLPIQKVTGLWVRV